MRKKIRKIFVLPVVLCLAMGLVLNVSAGSVTYEGNTKKFVFEPGSAYSPTDLFSDFKGVMPGDSITQKISINNDVKKDVKIKLYIKSSGATENSVEFLGRLKLTVSQDGDSKLFDAPANETAQLTEWVYLGTFYSGAQIDLNVTLDVPLELDDTYQEAVGCIDWQLKVDELPVEPDDPKLPQTGDGTNLYLYIILVFVNGIAIFLLLVGKYRKQKG